MCHYEDVMKSKNNVIELSPCELQRRNPCNGLFSKFPFVTSSVFEDISMTNVIIV